MPERTAKQYHPGIDSIRNGGMLLKRAARYEEDMIGSSPEDHLLSNGAIARVIDGKGTPEETALVESELALSGVTLESLRVRLPYEKLSTGLSSIRNTLTFTQQHLDDPEWKTSASRKILRDLRKLADDFEKSLK